MTTLSPGSRSCMSSFRFLLDLLSPNAGGESVCGLRGRLCGSTRGSDFESLFSTRRRYFGDRGALHWTLNAPVLLPRRRCGNFISSIFLEAHLCHTLSVAAQPNNIIWTCAESTFTDFTVWINNSAPLRVCSIG
ncbi:hypothetical protein B0H12DRAFT_1170524 [Mycena haematopus]|nr:hypothetical protein B0H12DRAFT_1170524 [Mycena haematopus]